jgi:hypothetical protein
LLAWVAIDARQSQDGTIKWGLHRSRRSAIIMSSRLPALILIAAPLSSRSRYSAFCGGLACKFFVVGLSRASMEGVAASDALAPTPDATLTPGKQLVLGSTAEELGKPPQVLRGCGEQGSLACR